MWLCTQHGFFSIVQKSKNEFHVRARTKRDLENLKRLIEKDGDVKTPDIEEWPAADYRWRIIVTARAVQWVLCRFVDALDYTNFKGRIAKLPDQADKQAAYHDLWHAGVRWQSEEIWPPTRKRRP